VRYVVDSSVYVELLRRGSARPDLVDLLHKLHRHLWMSAVVAMELEACAVSRAGRTAVRALVEPFRFRERLIVPMAPDWIKAGSVLARLTRRAGVEEHGRSRLVCDALIAVSARRTGATVVTRDASDFRRIASVFDFGLETIG
jgi:predicted nucleic acid-binding protein